MGTRGKRRHKRENLSLYSFRTTDVGGRSCWLWLSRHIVEILHRKEWSRDGEGGDSAQLKEENTLSLLWHAPEPGQCSFILLASFHPLLSTICEASLFCVNRWGPERWRNEASTERGTCNGKHKKPHHLKLSVKSIIQTNVFHAWKFQGLKGSCLTAWAIWCGHMIYRTERCSQKWWEGL